MSKLRNNLESAREDYRQIRYDGDLAAELLIRGSTTARQPQRGLRWMWQVGALTAAAAALVLLVRPQSPVPVSPSGGDQIAIALPITEVEAEPGITEVAWRDMPALAMPSGPSDMDTRGTEEMNMAPAMDFSLSVPSFSLAEEQIQPEQQSWNAANAQEILL